MQLYANWNFPTHVKIGSGTLAEIGNCCKDLKINQPLIVTDKTLISSEIVQRLENELSLSADNVVLRGCSLKNTEYIS